MRARVACALALVCALAAACAGAVGEDGSPLPTDVCLDVRGGLADADDPDAGLGGAFPGADGSGGGDTTGPLGGTPPQGTKSLPSAVARLEKEAPYDPCAVPGVDPYPPDTYGPGPDAGPGGADDAGGQPDVVQPPPDTDEPPQASTIFPHAAGWPAPNTYSWDGAWRPGPGELPVPDLLDDEYDDGHTTWSGNETPVLPPGEWDWNDANDDVANWRSFEGSVGRFEPLLDPQGRQFGWRLLGNTPEAVPFNGPAHYFEGTPGVDLLHLGPGGRINSDTGGNLGEGPDVLVFDEAWSLDFRTGSTQTGGARDNDLVIGGCNDNLAGEYDIYGATFHTGPGADRIYVRDVRAAALDAGNGDGGLTSVLDPLDGDDVIVVRGNMKDFRVFGGAGDDTAVWYLDELPESISFAGPNFFGGGGAGDAVWDTAGTDRLVLVIPPDTRIVGQPPTQPGDLMVSHYYGNIGDFSWDEPVYDDLYARYCVTCGTGPGGRKTLNLEYRPLAGPGFTGWFFVTDFEELQLGIGPDAVVYRVDQGGAVLTPAPDLAPFRPDPWPEAWCETPPGSGYVPDDGGPGPGPDDGTLYWPPAGAAWPPGDAPVAAPGALYPHGAAPGWPVPNAYSWDGSWVLGEYPFVGLFDDEYNDGHRIFDGTTTPVLPPGQWDWDDDRDDIANWRNFASSIGTFAPLLDAQRRQFGWRLEPLTPAAVDYTAASHYFEGTAGTDILDLGPGGLLHSFTVGDLGDGPDVVVFDRAWSLDFRTGNSLRGSARDNDLLIAGCSVDEGFDIQAASFHTGPGSDWIFARDTTGAAFDAGNGDGGVTDVLDPEDGDDLVVLDGAMADFRVFGGAGDDTVVWYLDDNAAGDISFLGPNLFGGGGAGDAVWDTDGTDRLVLDIPPDTPFITTTPTPPGALLFRIWSGDDGEIWWDDPVYDDVYARYCVTCGVGPGGRRTIQLEYRSADGSVFTGWFWVTDFEELQLGTGPDARVFRVDSAAGRAVADTSLVPFAPPAVPEGWCR